MKFYEALRLAQEEGKKIRQVNWQPNEFIYWEDSSNRLVFNYDRLFNIGNQSVGEDWELYEPLVTFVALNPGATFRLKVDNNIYHKTQLINDEHNAIYYDKYGEFVGCYFEDSSLVIFCA